jgi:hypothetical protein
MKSLVRKAVKAVGAAQEILERELPPVHANESSPETLVMIWLSKKTSAGRAALIVQGAGFACGTAVILDQVKVSSACFLVASEMNWMSLVPGAPFLISKTEYRMMWLVIGGQMP